MRAMFAVYAFLGVAAGLLYSRLPARPPAASGRRASALGPSRRIVYRLATLFGLDAFAGGFVVQALLALWLFEKLNLSLAVAGGFFFWSGVLSAFSFPVAARLADRFGLVNTMVFTHIPSSLCLIGAALAPTLWLALGLLLIRAALSQMDVPTRSSYVMAVVTEAERRPVSRHCRAASLPPSAQPSRAVCLLMLVAHCRCSFAAL
jgi:predicted MFS family arabinose efflux permease